jgi:hypothetical protein
MPRKRRNFVPDRRSRDVPEPREPDEQTIAGMLIGRLSPTKTIVRKHALFKVSYCCGRQVSVVHVSSAWSFSSCFATWSTPTASRPRGSSDDSTVMNAVRDLSANSHHNDAGESLGSGHFDRLRAAAADVALVEVSPTKVPGSTPDTPLQFLKLLQNCSRFRERYYELAIRNADPSVRAHGAFVIHHHKHSEPPARLQCLPRMLLILGRSSTGRMPGCS